MRGSLDLSFFDSLPAPHARKRLGRCRLLKVSYEMRWTQQIRRCLGDRFHGGRRGVRATLSPCSVFPGLVRTMHGGRGSDLVGPQAAPTSPGAPAALSLGSLKPVSTLARVKQHPLNASVFLRQTRDASGWYLEQNLSPCLEAS